MKSFQIVGAVFGLIAVVACSKSSLSTGTGPTADPAHVHIGTPMKTSGDTTPATPPAPMATPVDRHTLEICADEILSEYKKVQQACKGVDDPFSDPACYDVKEAFDEKHPDTACQSSDGATVICNRTDGSCADSPAAH